MKTLCFFSNSFSVSDFSFVNALQRKNPKRRYRWKEKEDMEKRKEDPNSAAPCFFPGALKISEYLAVAWVDPCTNVYHKVLLFSLTLKYLWKKCSDTLKPSILDSQIGKIRISKKVRKKRCASCAQNSLLGILLIRFYMQWSFFRPPSAAIRELPPCSAPCPPPSLLSGFLPPAKACRRAWAKFIGLAHHTARFHK